MPPCRLRFGWVVWGPQGVLIGQVLGGVIFGILGVWLAYRMILATPSRI